MSDELKVIVRGPDVARLMDVLRAAGYNVAKPTRCLGYPECDGDLPGEEHAKECPVRIPGDNHTWAKPSGSHE